MRLSSILEMNRRVKSGFVKRGSFVKEDNVPFQLLLPMSLRNKVSGKSDKSSGSPCVQEMSVLFACLNKNDYNNAKCAKELESFNKCYTRQVDLKKAAKSKELTGMSAPGEKRLSHRQLNELLRKYPS